ncbi:class D beta-lactamase [Paenibacillus elgii]|uniref:class D beta-lactamase n=1 Tax=Paenibacillus elgii TaxID=189691 RepID=UPI00203A827E|nr:class D beta-lactamase [Paenibacillus elgii]MCM3271886.1 class D beta-lactamase [Paenibacillus elgii]
MSPKFQLLAALSILLWAAGCSKPSPEAAGGTPAPGVSPEKKEEIRLNEWDLSSFFPSNNGTFIIRSLRTNQSYVFNETRAALREAPQSTFKVANALIGLQTGAVQDENTVKRWDGVKRSREIWNQDHTLATAMRHSTVWYYQAMARDIGNERMQQWLDAIDYGNKDISGGIDKFWNNSSLKISPMEEVEFITKLVQESLPFDKKVMQTVKQMIREEEQQPGYTLYGKTGGSSNPPFGWYVGFVQLQEDTLVFAAQVDGESGTLNKAKDITKLVLKERLLP